MIKRLVYKYRWELGVFWLVPFVAGGVSLAYLEFLFFELDLAMWPIHAQSFAILTVLIALSPALDGASFFWEFTTFAQHGWLAAPIPIWAMRIPHAVLAVFAIWVLTRSSRSSGNRARGGSSVGGRGESRGRVRG